MSTPVPDVSSRVGTPVPDAKDGSTASSSSSAELPPGLTSSSPSVLREAAIVEVYLRDPTNAEALLALISSSTAQSELEDARAWYEAFLKLFPTAAPQYLGYIELELSHDNQPEVEALFSRVFAKSPAAGPLFPLAYPPLWTAYLHYIRRQNALPPVPPSVATLPAAYLAARATITNAYEYALSHVGLDQFSTPIWKEYIQFIKEGETRTTWEEQGKVDGLRKIYTKVLRVPVEDIEGLWREYDMFEGQVSKVTAKKFLQERSPAYMTARSTLKELRTKIPASASKFPPPLPVRPTWSTQDRAIIASWKAYIEWETSNPLDLESEEELQARLSYALRKICGGEPRFFPEIWYIASRHASGLGNVDEAAGFLRSGIQANPSSSLLSFALAELEEVRKNFVVVNGIFTALISHLDTEVEKVKASVAAEIAGALAGLPEAPAESTELDAADSARAREEERRSKEAEVVDRRREEVEETEKGLGLVWIMHMRFARRSEGIKSARMVFARARKAGTPAWQVFEAAALNEFHCSKDPAIATKIFELGLRAYSDKVDFVDRYLTFLVSINDDQNARVLFEKTVTKFSPELARPLWERWARYEYLFGELASAQRLDARFLETFPKDSATKNLARRHAYLGIDEIARVDLGFGVRLPAAPKAVVPPLASLAPSREPTPPPAASVTADASPAKRALPSDSDASTSAAAAKKKQDEDDRGGERLSMRNQPAAKRLKPSSPVRPTTGPAIPTGPSAGVARATEVVSRRDRSPPRGPASSVVRVKELSLAGFLDLLPPAAVFDGPVLPIEEMLGLLSSAPTIKAIHAAPVAPRADQHDAFAAGGGGGGSGRGRSGRRRGGR